MAGDYRQVNKLLLVGGLLYLLWPQIRQAFGGLGVQLPDVSRLLPASLTHPAILPGVTGAEQLAGATAPPGGGGQPSGIGAIGGVATTAIGAAATAGASAAAIAATAGVAAVGLIIAWGVTKQGWFRGGQEGVVVNPARDSFLAQFAPMDYTRDGRNPPGFYGMAWLLEAIEPGAGQGDGLYGELQHAHTKAAFDAAVTKIQALLAANREKAAQLWEYARRDPAAPQRSVTPAAA